jgi:hypothetical protein
MVLHQLPMEAPIGISFAAPVIPLIQSASRKLLSFGYNLLRGVVEDQTAADRELEQPERFEFSILDRMTRTQFLVHSISNQLCT